MGARGALTEELLENITNDTERVRAAFMSPEGLTRLDRDGQDRVGFTVIMVVTDERVVFVSDTAEVLAGSKGSIPYSDVAAATVVDDVLEIRTNEGDAWQFPLPDTRDPTVDAVTRHLEWVGELRNRILAVRNDVELGAGKVRELGEEMSWEDAEETYENIRTALDDVICAVQWTDPIDDQVLAPELTELERTLERAYARLFIQRSRSQLELGRQLVESDQYDQAETVLESAQEYHETARERAETVKRGDAFQFGEQRELADDLERLAWEIETVAAEPIRRAHEAKIVAETTEDPEAAVEKWETAFRRYGTVLSLDLGEDDRRFAGDEETVTADLRNAADELVDGHRELARERWNAGVESQSAGDTKAAISHCSEATDHIERAAELAGEFRPEATATLERRLEKMEDALRRMRATADVDRTHVGAPESRTGNAESEDTQTATSTDTPISAGELADIDTHHEIKYELAGRDRGSEADPDRESDTAAGDPRDSGQVEAPGDDRPTDAIERES